MCKVFHEHFSVLVVPLRMPIYFFPLSFSYTILTGVDVFVLM